VALGRAAGAHPDARFECHTQPLRRLGDPHWAVDHLVRETMQKEDFSAFLEHRLTVYTQGTIILIVDNYSNHCC
jgi:hypothetical protein